MRDAQRLTTFDFYYVKLVDSLTTTLLLSSIFDLTLYCAHELLHHDLAVRQTSLANISYVQSCLCLLLVTVEVLVAFESLRKLDVAKIADFEKRIECKKREILDQESSEQKKEELREQIVIERANFEY